MQHQRFRRMYVSFAPDGHHSSSSIPLLLQFCDLYSIYGERKHHHHRSWSYHQKRQTTVGHLFDEDGMDNVKVWSTVLPPVIIAIICCRQQNTHNKRSKFFPSSSSRHQSIIKWTYHRCSQLFTMMMADDYYCTYWLTHMLKKVRLIFWTILYCKIRR